VLIYLTLTPSPLPFRLFLFLPVAVNSSHTLRISLFFSVVSNVSVLMQIVHTAFERLDFVQRKGKLRQQGEAKKCRKCQ
jgi:hypothetical protein